MICPDINSLLEQAYNSYQAGEKADAKNKYEQIIAIDKGHAEANYRLAILEVEAGKVLNAIDNFRVAIRSSPDESLYWKSLVETLLRVGKPNSAKNVLKEAAARNVMDDSFEGLLRLAELQAEKSKVLHPPQDKQKLILRLYEQRDFADALRLSLELSRDYPLSNVPHDFSGSIHAAQGNHKVAADFFRRSIEIYPGSASSHSNLGSMLYEFGQYEDAIHECELAIECDPSYAIAYNNLANCQVRLERYKSAEENYQKAIQLKPDFVDAISNLGAVFLKQKKAEEAVSTLNDALQLQRHHYDAHNNLGNAHKELGDLRKSIQHYKISLSGRPQNLEPLRSLVSLEVQLYDAIGTDHLTAATEDGNLPQDPLLLIYLILYHYAQGHINDCVHYVNQVTEIGEEILSRLSKDNLLFFAVYREYIRRLLAELPREIPKHNAILYHIGESHCLSYAHHFLRINGVVHKVVPKITFGAKAYHLGNPRPNSFQSITEYNLQAIPEKSLVLFSFGEIDCRIDEGIIAAAGKADKQLASFIEGTVKRYVDWCSGIRSRFQHDIFILNVPAPMLDPNLTARENHLVAETVQNFNLELSRQCAIQEFNLIDCYTLTNGKDNFSNEKYHIDRKHLDARALSFIENQLA